MSPNKSEPIILVFLGQVDAVKNEKMPVRRRSGKLGLTTKPAAKLTNDRLAMQIPGHLRDLRLEHPHIEVWFHVTRDTVDRDNIYSTLLDLLTKYGVLVDDNIRRCNGTVVLHPATLCDVWKTVIRLTPREDLQPCA